MKHFSLSSLSFDLAAASGRDHHHHHPHHPHHHHDDDDDDTEDAARQQQRQQPQQQQQRQQQHRSTLRLRTAGRRPEQPHQRPPSKVVVAGGSRRRRPPSSSEDHHHPHHSSPPSSSHPTKKQPAVVHIVLELATEYHSFALLSHYILQREDEMRQVAASLGIAPDRWQGSRLYRAYQEALAAQEQAQEQAQTTKTTTNTSTTAVTVQLPDPAEYCVAHNLSHALPWTSSLTRLIQEYYETGRLHIASRAQDHCHGSSSSGHESGRGAKDATKDHAESNTNNNNNNNNCDDDDDDQHHGKHVLLALEYFGILYQPDQLVFDSFAAYQAVKEWSDYLTLRSHCADLVATRLLQQCAAAGIHGAPRVWAFGTTRDPTTSERLTLVRDNDKNNNDKNNDSALVGTGGLPVLDAPDPARLYDCFNTSARAAAMRHDFALYVQHTLTHVQVRFDVRRVHVVRPRGTDDQPWLARTTEEWRAVLFCRVLPSPVTATAVSSGSPLTATRTPSDLSYPMDELVQEDLRAGKLEQLVQQVDQRHAAPPERDDTNNNDNDDDDDDDGKDEKKTNDNHYSPRGVAEAAQRSSSMMMMNMMNHHLNDSQEADWGHHVYQDLYETREEEGHESNEDDSQGSAPPLPPRPGRRPVRSARTRPWRKPPPPSSPKAATTPLYLLATPRAPVTVVRAASNDYVSVTSALTGPFNDESVILPPAAFSSPQAAAMEDSRAQAVRHEWMQGSLLNRDIDRRVRALLDDTTTVASDGEQQHFFGGGAGTAATNHASTPPMAAGPQEPSWDWLTTLCHYPSALTPTSLSTGPHDKKESAATTSSQSSSTSSFWQVASASNLLKRMGQDDLFQAAATNAACHAPTSSSRSAPTTSSIQESVATPTRSSTPTKLSSTKAALAAVAAAAASGQLPPSTPHVQPSEGSAATSYSNQGKSTDGSATGVETKLSSTSIQPPQSPVASSPTSRAANIMMQAVDSEAVAARRGSNRSSSRPRPNLSSDGEPPSALARPHTKRRGSDRDLPPPAYQRPVVLAKEQQQHKQRHHHHRSADASNKKSHGYGPSSSLTPSSSTSSEITREKKGLGIKKLFCRKKLVDGEC